MFLLKFITSLTDIDNLIEFYNEILDIDIDLSFNKLATDFFRIEDESLKSYVVFGYLDNLLKFKDSYGKWVYWKTIPSNIKQIPISANQRKLFMKRLETPRIREYYQNLIPDFNDTNKFQQAINTFFYRIRIIKPMQPYTHGFTTANLYIFLSNLGIQSNELTLCGTFIILVHELSHFLRRSLRQTVEEASGIHTLRNEIYETSEGGDIDEKVIFGGHISFVTESAAQYFVHANDFEIEHFISLVKIGLLEAIPEEHGLVLKKSRSQEN